MLREFGHGPQDELRAAVGIEKGILKRMILSQRDQDALHMAKAHAASGSGL
jgi:hypothetical protein